MIINYNEVADIIEKEVENLEAKFEEEYARYMKASTVEELDDALTHCVKYVKYKYAINRLYKIENQILLRVLEKYMEENNE